MMNQRTILQLAMLPAVAALFACANEPAATAGHDQPKRASASNTPSKSVKHDVATGEAGSGASAVPDDPAIIADPDAALAAIPKAMQPATLLPLLKTKLLVPDVKNGGVAMFTDVVTIEPGADITFCTYVAGTTKEVTYIHNTRGSQSMYGHHAILQYTATPQDVGTRPCSQESLQAQQGQIIGGTGGEGTTNDELPSNVVSEVPAGAQFIINHHWINWGHTPLDVQAEMITIPPKAGDALMIARALAIVVTGFNVAPGATGDDSGECTFKEDMNMLSMLGHEHRWGTHVKAERMGKTPDVIFDHDYDPDMVSQPITNHYSVDEPYRFNKGDSVRMTCEWNNTSDSALTFPHEMCVLFGWRLGGDHDATCYGGSWF